MTCVELEHAAHGADYMLYTECERTTHIYRGHTSFPTSVGLAQAHPNHKRSRNASAKKYRNEDRSG